MNVFFSDDDYLTYIDLLKKASLRGRVGGWGHIFICHIIIWGAYWGQPLLKVDIKGREE
jgi:hypothetical protein